MPDASQDDIKRAYYTLAKKYHPDKNRSHQSVAENRLQVLNEAYEALKTPFRRQKYDASLKQKRNAWSSSITAMDAANDSQKEVKPFPWMELTKVG